MLCVQTRPKIPHTNPRGFRTACHPLFPFRRPRSSGACRGRDAGVVGIRRPIRLVLFFGLEFSRSPKATTLVLRWLLEQISKVDEQVLDQLGPWVNAT
jgi:hypothetical protein